MNGEHLCCRVQLTRFHKKNSIDLTTVLDGCVDSDLPDERSSSGRFHHVQAGVIRTHLGPSAIEYITALFNLSVTACQIPAIWKSTLIIPIPKPGKATSVGTSYRPISLLCPAAKVLESLILPTVNKYLQPAPDQHGFRPDHSTTSALLQMTTDIAIGFNQRKHPDRTICVAVVLSADQQITAPRPQRGGCHVI